MDPLGPEPGPEQKMADQGTNGPIPIPLPAERAELPRPRRPRPFLRQHEQVAVEKQELHGERPRHAEPLQRAADGGETGHGHQDERRPDGQDGPEGIEAKESQPAADPESAEADQHLPVEQRVEHPHQKGKRETRAIFAMI